MKNKIKIFINRKVVQFKNWFNEFLETKMFHLENPTNDLNLEHLNNLDDYKNLEESEQKKLMTFVESIYWGINQKSVFNIALLGGFGSGKSTILKYLIKQKKLTNFLSISLAKFGEGEGSDEEGIEYSIIEQLIFSVNSNQIPNSKFNRITKTRYLILKSWCLFIFVYSILYLFFPDVNEVIAIFPKCYLTEYGMKSFFLLGILVVIYKSLKRLSNFGLKKISLSDIEISNEDKTASLLNKHIDEIVYFFKETNKRIVFIEDLDRFESSSKVFAKLREINVILNNSIELKGNKITFIYAVKNDFLGNHDDTNKFFELVVPVMPFISHESSKNAFIKYLGIDSLEDNNKDILNFIVKVSKYIYDTRTIISISNDFKITKSIFETQVKTEIDFELLAFSVYKTIFNGDYDNLLNRKGLLFNVFQNKHILIKKITAKLKSELDILKQVNDESRKEELKSIGELKSIFIYTALSKLDQHDYFNKPNSYYLEDENFENYYESELRSSRNNRIINGFKSLENELGIDYHSRKKSILNKSKDKQDENKLRIDYLEKEILKLNSYSLKDIYNSGAMSFLESVDCIFDLQEDLERESEAGRNFNQLIKDFLAKKFKIVENRYFLFQILVAEGHINESYPNYLSYSHNNYLDSDSEIFKNCVINNEGTDHQQIFKNPERIIEYLEPNYFKNEGVLNISIMNELFKNNIEKARILIFQFEKPSLKKAEIMKLFICSETARIDEKRFFIKELLTNDFFWNIFSELNFIDDKVELIVFILENLEHFFFQDQFSKLRDIVKSDEDILNKIDYNKHSIVKILSHLNYKLESLDSISDSNIQKQIKQNKLLKLNKANLVNLVGGEINLNIENIFNLYNSKSKYWSEQALDEDREQIINILSLSKYTELNQDLVQSIVLENDEIEISVKMNFIKNVDFKLNHLLKITPDLMSQLLINNKIECNWINIITYFTSVGFDDSLIEFINRNTSKLQSDIFNFVENPQNILLESILCSPNIKSILIFDSCQIKIGDLSNYNFSANVFEYLVTKDFVEISKVNFNVINSEMQLIFANKYFNISINNEDVLEYIIHPEFEQVLNIYDGLHNNKQVAINVTEYLIKNYVQNINIDSFSTGSPFYEYILEISDELLYEELVLKLIGYEVSKSFSYNLAIKFIKVNENFNSVINSLGFSRLELGERIKILNNELNLMLVEVLYAKGYISSPNFVNKNKEISIKRI
jgi:hypothetical protein